MAYLLANSRPDTDYDESKFTADQADLIQSTMVPGTDKIDQSSQKTLLHDLNLPEYTLRAIETPAAPQAKAYEWLIGNRKHKELPQWRLIQRFVLAWARRLL